MARARASTTTEDGALHPSARQAGQGDPQAAAGPARPGLLAPLSALLARSTGSGRGGGPPATTRLLGLQQTVGNRAVQRLLQRMASNAAPAVEAPEEAPAGGPADTG